jgi:hypothetical protein
VRRKEKEGGKEKEKEKEKLLKILCYAGASQSTPQTPKLDYFGLGSVVLRYATRRLLLRSNTSPRYYLGNRAGN